MQYPPHAKNVMPSGGAPLNSPTFPMLEDHNSMREKEFTFTYHILHSIDHDRYGKSDTYVVMPFQIRCGTSTKNTSHTLHGTSGPQKSY